MNLIIFLFFIVSNIFFKSSLCLEDTCSNDGSDVSCLQSSTISNFPKKFLLYDVNPGEGFNLRRDVYMRIATMVKKLNEEHKFRWTLVLPPWGPLYHWKSKDIGYQGQIKWSQFFDVNALKKYVPVMEFEEFVRDHGPKIDIVYYLQHYEEGWADNKWEERFEIRKCIDSPPYQRIEQGKFLGWFWGYESIHSSNFDCLSIQGYSSTLKNFISSLNYSVIMIDRAEVILHDEFGNSEYWQVRRSMQFAKYLIQLGDEFRKEHLNSSDDRDKTEKYSAALSAPVTRRALGGPYLAAHLRRRDFVRARPKDVPSIEFTAQQLLKKMKEQNLDILFVATDASEEEFQELKKLIPSAKCYVPMKRAYREILDGEFAIIDQWICAHARYFTGTFESTFSFRIQEEREILGFPIDSTFNRICGNNQTSCPQPSKWTIVWK